MSLWNSECEKNFFSAMLNGVASEEKLFYNLPCGSFAYVPKGEDAEGKAL